MFGLGKYSLEGRIVNVMTGEPIPPDEPIFLLRAKDILSTGAIQSYAAMLKALSHAQEVAGDLDSAKRLDDGAYAIERFSHHFENWQLDNKEKVKWPD